MYSNPNENAVKYHESQSEAKAKQIAREMAPYTAEVLDPFTLEQQLSYLQILKVCVLSVTLLPLRICLMLVVLLFAWIVGVITLRGIPDEEEKGIQPLSGWRRRWAKPFIVKFARFIFVIGGWHWIPQKGQRATAKEAPILLVAPHSSFWDTVVVIALGCPGMVAIESTRRAPLFGTLTRYMQPLYVKTGDPDSRRQISKDIFDRVTSGKDFEQLLIFPEGGCANRKSLLQFKLGGFAPGVPVQPAFIRYRNNLDTVSWCWNGPPGWKQMLLTLTQFHIYCEVEFLPVYKPSEMERKNPRLFADNVQSYISKWTDTPITKFSLEDARFLNKARQLQLPPTVGLAKFLRLRKAIGHQDLDPKEEIQKLQNERRGDITAFANYLGIERCPEVLKDFFHTVDQTNKGSIDFRIYAVALCLIRNDLTNKGKLEAAFQMFDKKQNAELVAAIFLLWKGVPYSLASMTNVIISD